MERKLSLQPRGLPHAACLRLSCGERFASSSLGLPWLLQKVPADTCSSRQVLLATWYTRHPVLPIREFQFSSVRKDAGAVRRGRTSLCWYPATPSCPPTPSHPSFPACYSGHFTSSLSPPPHGNLSRLTSSRCVIMDLKSLDTLRWVYIPTWQIRLWGPRGLGRPRDRYGWAPRQSQQQVSPRNPPLIMTFVHIGPF